MNRYVLVFFFIAVLSICSSSSSCPLCALELDDVRQARLQVIQREILEKLGLLNVPNVTGRNIPKIPPVLKLIQSEGMSTNTESENADEDNFHSKTQRIILFPDKVPPLSADQVRPCCYFTFTGKANKPELRIYKAKLQVYVKRKPNTTGNARSDLGNITIRVYQRDYPIFQGTPRKILIASKPLKRGREESWYTFNIRHSVKQWRKRPSRNLGLDLELDANDFYVLAQGENTESQPFLEVFTKDKKRRRLRRKIGLDCGRGSREKRCCRRQLIVDFQQFGWDWIIAPLRFAANYCTGECQAIMLTQYPHAHLVTKAQGTTNTTCCSPSKMSPISLLYFGAENKIIHEEVPAMIADTCGCA